jgi:GIY-YIG catalytic domain/NUMOD1 domain
MINKLFKNLNLAKKLLSSKLNKQAGIYKLINLKNNKSYVGSSNNLFRRLSQHCNLNLNKSTLLRCRSRISSALLKYGPENFGLVILEFINFNNNELAKDKRSKILSTEQFFIDLIKPEYNLLSIAGSLRKWTEKELAEKITKIGPKNVSHRKNAKHRSDSKALMSENSTVKKTIHQYNSDGKYLTSYPSITAASLATGIPGNRIGKYADKIPAVLLKENMIINFTKKEKLENIQTIAKPGDTSKIIIYAYYPNGSLFKIFSSITEAGKYFDMDHKKIQRWAKKNQNKTDLTMLSVCDNKYIFTFEPIN